MPAPAAVLGAGRFAGGRWLFLGRRGGRSRGPFAELNLSYSVGDDPGAVLANRGRVEALVGAPLAWPRQVHGARVLEPDRPGEAGEADALVTCRPGLALLVLTADCVPVVVAAPGRAVAGIAHAGWRGTAAGVVGVLAERVAGLSGAARGELIAVIGPAIGPCCYAVGADVALAVSRTSGGADEGLRRPGPAGTFLLDLREANRRQLLRSGLAPDRIRVVGPCTACACSELFSHRASGGRTGRHGSLVVLDG